MFVQLNQVTSLDKALSHLMFKSGEQATNLKFVCFANQIDIILLLFYFYENVFNTHILNSFNMLLLGLGFPAGDSGREPACQCRKRKRLRFDPWVRKIPWRRRAWQPTPLFSPGESHGQRNLVSYNPYCRRASNTAKATQHASTPTLLG